MIKLKPEKSRMAVIAYSFAIFSPSSNICSQKKDTDPPISVNSETVNPSEAERGLQSPPKITNGSLNQIDKSFGVYGHAIQLNGVIGGGNQINNNRIENIAGVALNPHDILNLYKSNGLCAAASISRGFHGLKSIFIKNGYRFSTTMTGFFKKMMKIYHFDNQFFYKAKLKYTAILFLYN